MQKIFFGFDVALPTSTDRHLTLAYLGLVDSAALFENLSRFPKPPFCVSPTGTLDEPFHKKAWHATLNKDLAPYREQVLEFLLTFGYAPDLRPFIPHITAPEGGTSFALGSLHLFEGKNSLWRLPLKAGFEPVEHSADLAFLVRGETLQELYGNAQRALAFEFPEILPYYDIGEAGSPDAIVEALNRAVTRLDSEKGAPLKAVSYHGKIEKSEYLEWEMIVDV